MFVTAVLETFIGLTLVTGIGVRAGVVVLGGALFFGDMFPGGTPMLEAQYVFKDIVLAAAAAVVAAKVLRRR